MNRGDLWTVVGGSDFLSKPRPAVVIQSNRHITAESITICPLSSTASSAYEFRAGIQPTDENGLIASSVARADLVTTVLQSRLGRRIGHLNPADLARVEQAIIQFLELDVSE
ncbi:MAG: type II toxin-antitoxin system PemK/MazF family toxin [Chloroflexi bacterium]|nr:type II toxin-antitoxin system PemK/MazF family toxin [Chloroflexota bacterium]